MNITVTIRYIGLVIVVAGFFMLVSAAVGAMYGDDSWDILLVSGLIVIGFALYPLIFVPRPKMLSIREAVVVVAGAWVFTSIAGALPFYLWGPPFNSINALFESSSGFTTTGASILENIESIPKGLLFWRSMTNWLGGTGIIVFAIAVLPAIGQVSNVLLGQESSGLSVQRMFPRAKIIAQVIVKIYVGLTLAETLLLMVFGLPLFDALTTSFATIATGGFSPRNLSIGAYNHLGVEIAVIAFMVVSGMNFAFLYGSLTTRSGVRRGWEIARFYLIFLAVGAIISTLSIYGKVYDNLGTALRYASFQVISVGSSTGFATADSAVWTPSSHIIMIMMSLICACAGSTSGGIKIDRILLLLKLIRQKLKQLIHPSMVKIVRMDGVAIEMESAKDSSLFIVFYLSIVVISTFFIAFTGADLLESFTGTVACMGNVGPGLGKVGTVGNYNFLSDSAKFVLCGVMLLGRLEIYVLLLPITKSFWKS